jgi:hypothetical protein
MTLLLWVKTSVFTIDRTGLIKLFAKMANASAGM